MSYRLVTRLKRKSKPSGHDSPDVKLLREVLEKSTGAAVSKTLSDSLMNISPTNLEDLEEILAPLIDDVSESLHCGRCHEEYFQAGNHSKACVVACNEEPGDCSDGDDEDLQYYTTPCCLVKFSECDDGPGDICFKTWHTNDSRKVHYFKGYYARDEDKSEKGCSSRNENVVTCRFKGCDVLRA